MKAAYNKRIKYRCFAGWDAPQLYCSMPRMLNVSWLR